MSSRSLPVCALLSERAAWVQTLRAKDEDGHFRIENPIMVLITSAATVIFLLLWQKFGRFYLFGAGYLLILLFTYRNSERFSRKNILFNVGMTLVLITAIYLIFDRLMQIRL